MKESLRKWCSMGVYESEAKLEEKLIDQLVKQGYKKFK